jgi:hypothetical protein
MNDLKFFGSRSEINVKVPVYYELNRKARAIIQHLFVFTIRQQISYHIGISIVTPISMY